MLYFSRSSTAEMYLTCSTCSSAGSNLFSSLKSFMYIHVLHVYFLSCVHAGLGLRFVMCEHGASFESVCMISGVSIKKRRG